ncbi:MAG: AI-2E family transporter [Lachnospiraceae bacterium]
MEFSKENIKKIRGLILYTIIILVCLWKYTMVLEVLSFVFNILFPFILGGAIAFIINVPTHFFEVHIFKEERVKNHKILQKIARPISLIITLLCVIGAVTVVLFVMIPQLGQTFMSLGNNVQAFIPKIQEWAGDIFNNNEDLISWIGNLQLDWQNIASAVMSFFTDGTGSVLDSTFAVAKNIVSGFASFFIAFAFACYIILQKERLNVQIRKVLFAFVPKGKAEATLEVCSLTYKIFSGFLTGQCLEAIILGTMFVIAMTVLRLPYALLIGVIVAFTALIPIFGSFIACILGAFMIFIVSPAQALGFVVLFLILQQIEGNLIYPHVVGNSVGLPSIWVLAAVSLGGSLMGITGMLIFIPIVSVVYALFREVVYLKLKKNNIKFEE